MRGAGDVIDIGKLKSVMTPKQLTELDALYRDKKRTAEAIADGAEAIAGKIGFHPAVVKKFVEAHANGKLGEAALRAKQLSILFEEL